MKAFIFVLLTLFASQAMAASWLQKQLITAGDMSATINSTGAAVANYNMCSVSAVYTGSPVGSLKVQISNDIVDDASLVVNWSDYSGSSTSLSAAGDFVWNFGTAPFRYMRVVYTKTSGTGTINSYVTCKGQSLW